MSQSSLHARLAVATGDRSFRHLAELTGTHPETVRRYMQGAAPSVEFIAALCQALGINSNWLLSGAGPMLGRDMESTSLKNAGPADLLRHAAQGIESLSARLETLERYASALEARVSNQASTLPVLQVEVLSPTLPAETG